MALVRGPGERRGGRARLAGGRDVRAMDGGPAAVKSALDTAARLCYTGRPAGLAGEGRNETNVIETKGRKLCR